MSDDMSNVIQKMSDMLKNNQIPDDIKNLMNHISNGSSKKESKSSANYSNDTNANSNFDANDLKDMMSRVFASSSNDSTSDLNGSSNEQDDCSASNTELPNFDIGTMLKMKSIIDSMNKPQNDPRANLLKSLKPYLKPSRKDKVDQYIKLFSMGKVFEMMGPLGGEKKNDV